MKSIEERLEELEEKVSALQYQLEFANRRNSVDTGYYAVPMQSTGVDYWNFHDLPKLRAADTPPSIRFKGSKEE